MDHSLENQLDEIMDQYERALGQGAAPSVDEFLKPYGDLPESAKSELREAMLSLRMLTPAKKPLSNDPASQEHGPIGRVLGDYRIVGELGRGGMGVVYVAEQLSLGGRRVALKILPFADCLDQKRLQRFRNEAVAAANLNHDHIVPVYGIYHERGEHFFAMQYIDGQSLADLIADRMRVKATPDTVASARPETTHVDTKVNAAERQSQFGASHKSVSSDREFHQAARWGQNIAEALQHAHDMGVVHRDIKPSNLLIDVSGRIWLADFGLAAFRDSEHALTMTGDLLGTLRYMSPEQARGRHGPLDQRTDIYSLGISLYELVTRSPAFPGTDRQSILRAVMEEEPRPPRQIRPEIPADLETIILKATAKEPSARYQSAIELSEDLNRFGQDEPILAKRTGRITRLFRWARRHRRLVLGSFIATVSSALVLLIAFIWSSLGWTQAMHAERIETGQRQRAEKAADQAHALQKMFLALVEHNESGLGYSHLRSTLQEHLKRAPARLMPDTDRLTLRNCAIENLARPDWRRVAGTEPPSDVRLVSWRNMVAWNSTHQRYAAANQKGEILIIDGENGNELLRLPGFGEAAFFLMFSPDDRWLAVSYGKVGDNSAICRLWPIDLCEKWDFANRIPLAEWRAPLVMFSRMFDFNRSGDQFVRLESFDDKVLLIWTDLLGTQMANRKTREINVYPLGVRLAPGGNSTVVLSGTSASLWTPSDDPPLDLPNSNSNATFHAAWHPRGDLLAISTAESIVLWDAVKNTTLGKLNGHDGPVIRVEFSGDGTLLATTAWDGSVRVWDLVNGCCVMKTAGSNASFATRRESLEIQNDRQLEKWEWTRHVRPIGPAYDRFLHLRHFDLSRDGSRVTAFGHDGSFIWNVVTGEIETHEPSFGAGVFHRSRDSATPDNTCVFTGVAASSAGDNAGGLTSFLRRALPKNLLPQELNTQIPKMSVANTSVDGKWLIGALFDGNGIEVWELMDKAATRRYHIETPIDAYTLSLSPDRKWLAASGQLRTGVMLWKLTDDHADFHADLWPDSGGAATTFSPDGKWFGAINGSRTRFWAVNENWRMVQELPRSGANEHPGPLAFSSDSQHVVVGGSRTVAKILAVGSWSERARLTSPDQSPMNLAKFSSDDRLLAVLSARHIQLWDLGSIRKELVALDLDY